MHKHAQMHLCVSMHEKMKSAVYGVDGMQLLHDVPFWPSVFALLCSGAWRTSSPRSPLVQAAPSTLLAVCLSVCLSLSLAVFRPVCMCLCMSVRLPVPVWTQQESRIHPNSA